MLVLCSGWVGGFALDDALCAGRIVDEVGTSRADAAIAASLVSRSFPTRSPGSARAPTARTGSRTTSGGAPARACSTPCPGSRRCGAPQPKLRCRRGAGMRACSSVSWRSSCAERRRFLRGPPRAEAHRRGPEARPVPRCGSRRGALASSSLVGANRIRVLYDATGDGRADYVGVIGWRRRRARRAAERPRRRVEPVKVGRPNTSAAKFTHPLDVMFPGAKHSGKLRIAVETHAGGRVERLPRQGWFSVPRRRATPGVRKRLTRTLGLRGASPRHLRSPRP